MQSLILLAMTVCLSLSAIAGIKEDITFLASDKMNGRVSGSPENKEVQTWLIERLTALKVRPAGDQSKKSFSYPFENSYDFRANQKIRGTNIIGILYPQNTWTIDNPKVIMGAHFDHVSKCWKKFDDADEICNGAADNAAAVAVVLAAAQTLASDIQAPVALAFWDGEESGLLGSDAFLQSPSFNLNQVVAYINLDIIGLNLAAGLESHHMIIGSETGGSKLETLVQNVTATETKIKYNQLSYAFGHGRSDMTSFMRHNFEIPLLFFSDGDGPVYHSSSDDVTKINFEKVDSITRVISKLTSQLTRLNNTELKFQKPTVHIDKGTFFQNVLTKIFGKDHLLKAGFPIPKFSDVDTVIKIYDITLENAEKNQLTPEEVVKLKKLHNDLKKIQAAGEKKFSALDYYKALQAGGTLTLTLRNLKFIP
ncbi:MAG: M28 family peptidase [Bdellovibrionaceae bacterium]|nr:M28 family peptidase [Pseudobdellovibrionaceae bacterium]